MFTLPQVQSIFDYGMLAYSQAYKSLRKDAIKSAATGAAAMTTRINIEAKMAAKVKQAVLAAGMEATWFNAHLSGNAFRVASDKQFSLSLKAGLEQLFAIEHIKTNENQSFIYGKGYFLIGLYNEAITTLETAVLENPSCIAHAYYYLGKSNSCLKNHESAKHYFLWLIQREEDPKLLSDYYDNIGMLYFQQGIYEEAITNYDLAIHNNGINLSALHNLALLYLTLATRSKDNETNFETDHLNSQNLLNKIFEHEPNHAHALHTQDSLCELIENYEQAITHYLQARIHCSAEDKATLSAITANLAECYAQSGHGFYQAQDYPAAEAFYNKSLEEDPQHHISKNQLGMCLYKSMDFNGARRHFNALINYPISRNPNQNEIEDNQEVRADAWINRAASLRKTGAFRLSKGSLSMAMDLSPNDATLSDENRELAAAIIQQKYRFFKQTANVALQEQESVTQTCSDTRQFP